jgi:DNA-binding Lrp family transcriptional regulator
MVTQNSTDKDRAILMFLLKNNNEPTHATGIAKKSANISRAWAGKRCEYLKEKGVIDCVMKRPSRQKHDTEYYFIASTIDAVRMLVDTLKHDPPMRQVFMNSQYYRNMIRVLVDEFEDSLAAIGLSLHDIFQHISDLFGEAAEHICHKIYAELSKIIDMDKTIHKLGNAQKEEIISCLERSWFALRFILYYLFSDIETKRQIILNIVMDSQLITVQAGREMGMLSIVWQFIVAIVRCGNSDARDHVYNEYETGYRVFLGQILFQGDAGKLPCSHIGDLLMQMDWVRGRYPVTPD